VAPIPAGIAVPASLLLSGAALFGLGAAKVLVTERNFFKSGLEMLVVGGAAAGVAYVVGVLLKGLGAMAGGPLAESSRDQSALPTSGAIKQPRRSAPLSRRSVLSSPMCALRKSLN
jgi:hypothetical protein